MSSESIQALSALSRAAQVTSNNLANSNTPGFKSSRAHLEDGPNGEGVRVSHVAQDASPGPDESYAVSGQPAEAARFAEGANVDVAREMVDLMQTQNAFSANAVMVREWDRTLGLVVDLKV